MNNFEIILNEQTPKVSRIENIKIFIDKNLDKLLDFLNFCKTQIPINTVGLAANQTSLNDERFMVNVFAIKENNIWKLIINPIINQYIGIKENKCESCLTWPHKFIFAERNRTINVNYYDINCFEHKNEMLKSFIAQIWQHETNHLNGINEKIEKNFIQFKLINVNRNDNCPCGSNKKYKNCLLLLLL